MNMYRHRKKKKRHMTKLMRLTGSDLRPLPYAIRSAAPARPTVRLSVRQSTGSRLPSGISVFQFFFLKNGLPFFFSSPVLLRCAAAALRPRVPSPEWVVCAHAHSHTRARCSQKVRSLATPDRHPFIYFPDSGHKTPGHQDTRTLGHPLLFLCLLCFACDKCDRQTVRQCDSATQRQPGGPHAPACCPLPAARCPLLPASTTHNPPAFGLILIDRCMDARMENGSFFIPVIQQQWQQHPGCIQTGLDAQNGACRSDLHRSALRKHSFPNLNRLLIILRLIRTWPPHTSPSPQISPSSPFYRHYSLVIYLYPTPNRTKPRHLTAHKVPLRLSCVPTTPASIGITYLIPNHFVIMKLFIYFKTSFQPTHPPPHTHTHSHTHTHTTHSHLTKSLC